MHDPLGFQMLGQQRYGDVMRLRIGPLLLHFLYHPEHVRRVLHTHQKNYLRGWHYRLLRQLFGENLVVSEGSHWLRQRRLAQPAFGRCRIEAYAAIMAESTALRLARWHEVAATGQPLNIGPEMASLALSIAGQTLFKRDIGSEADVVGKSFTTASEYLKYRFDHPFTSLPTGVPSPANRRFRHAAGTLNGVVLSLIQERRREEQHNGQANYSPDQSAAHGPDNSAAHGDLLSMLMQARDEETGEGMTDDELRSEVLAFLLAGHETTATALTWVWYLLACHTPIQEQVRAEIDSVCPGRTPSLAEVLQLEATRRVIDEALRLYPPIWAVSRQAVAADEIGGFPIPARSTLMLCPYVTHRHPEFWEQPERFAPDRFSAELCAARPRCAYFPFLGGPHQCIGNEFALLEMRLIVAMVIQQFHLELPSGQSIRPAASITLRPNGPVLLKLRRVK